MDAVRVTVTEHGCGEPVALRRRVDQISDVIGDGHRRGRRGRATPLFDQQPAAGLNRGSEVVLEPVLIGDDFGGFLTVDLGVDEIRHLRRGVVAPNDDVTHGFVEHARLERELTLCSVFVELGQRVEVARIQVGRVRQRDERVRVARVPDDDDLARRLRHLVQRLALIDENRPIHLKQISALHPRSTRLRPDQQRPIRAREDFPAVDADVDLAQQRKQAILQLHRHPLQRLSRPLAPEQSQHHRLIVSEHRPTRDLKQQVIRNLPRSRVSYTTRENAHQKSLKSLGRRARARSAANRATPRATAERDARRRRRERR